MNYIEQDSLGGPEVLVLKQGNAPEPGAGEVRIRTAAAGINPVDGAVRTGDIPLLGDPPFRIGWDVAGTIDAVGPDVTAFAVGDRVMGMVRFPKEAGAYADLVVAPAGELAKVGPALADAQAGALPLAGLTAWQGLVRHAGLKSGERVLIHAGGGGVGHLAIQIAKAQGAEVWTTVSAQKREVAEQMGADHIIDYKSEDFTAHGPFDVILDALGGDHATRSLGALAEGGRLVALLALDEGTEDAAKTQGKMAMRMMVAPDAEGMAALNTLAEEGKLTVLVSKTFPLAKAAQAHAFLKENAPGKVVLLA